MVDYARFVCACGASLKTPAGRAGRVRCPSCHGILEVPGPRPALPTPRIRSRRRERVMAVIFDGLAIFYLILIAALAVLFTLAALMVAADNDHPGSTACLLIGLVMGFLLGRYSHYLAPRK